MGCGSARGHNFGCVPGTKPSFLLSRGKILECSPYPSQVSMVVGFIITMVPSFEVMVIGHVFGFIITVVPLFEVIAVFKALSPSRDVIA